MMAIRTVPKPPDAPLLELLRAAGGVVRDLEAACQEHGLTHDQYNVLRILRGAQPHGHPRGEIGARLLSRAPDVTRMLDRLVRRGLVARGWHAENRRLSIATITPAGLALLRACDHGVQRVHARHAQALSATELKSLQQICRKLGP